MAELCGKDALRQLTELGFSRSDALDIVSFVAGVPYNEAVYGLEQLTLPYPAFQDALSKLSQHMPVAYITGRKEFYGLEFNVNQHTLIPRPDTEILIEAVLQDADRHTPHNILDLCTGSGCILLTLLHELPLAEGVGADISEEALKVAIGNAKKLNLAGRAEFIVSDIFKSIPADKKSNIITVNPPYISMSEYAESDISLGFEPRSALIAEEEGYIFYKYLLYTLSKLSNNSALLFLEVGYAQSSKVREMAHNAGYKTSIIKDLQGHDRVVKAYKTAE